LDWRPGPVKVGQKTQNTPTLRASPRRTPHPIKKIFFNRTKKTRRILRGFEQLSSYSGWRVITKKTRANLLARAVVKGYPCVCSVHSFNLCVYLSPLHVSINRTLFAVTCIRYFLIVTSHAHLLPPCNKIFSLSVQQNLTQIVFKPIRS